MDNNNSLLEAKEVELVISGMTCAACANRVERNLNKLDGVNATVNYATEKAKVTFDTAIDTSTLIETVKESGYGATLKNSIQTNKEVASEEPIDRSLETLRQRLIISTLLTIPVIAMAMIPTLQFRNWQWLSLVLAAPVIIWGAYPFHRAAFINAKHGASTMDTLISIGTLASLGWSLYALFWGNAGEPGMTHAFELTISRMDSSANIYLEAGAGVTMFILAGKYFEAKSKRRAGSALRALLELGAKEVSVLRNGQEVLIDVNELGVGEHFVVRPGEKIATDGKIIEGSSALDVSMLTGESIPIDVGINDDIVGGTINTTGRLIVEATRIGSDTQLAQMAKLVEEAQTGKAQVQRLADRISGVFVPIVILLSIATFIYWVINGDNISAAFTASVAVLIIACPCALGLATPMALMVGTGRGAQLGILIKGPEVLETTRKIDTILLDKTGTITKGEMTLIDYFAESKEDRLKVLQLGGSLEDASEHPIAKAIVDAAKNETELLSVKDFINVEGRGVQGTIQDQDGVTYQVVVGKVSYLESLDFEIPNAFNEIIDTGQNSGHSVVVIGWDDKARGIFYVADAIKPTSAQAIRNLQKLGLTPVLLTGDNLAVAHNVAKIVGIDEDKVIAEVLPRDKADVVKSFQDKGHSVAMVGDGVNDAVALAQADLGLSMGTGTDVAIQASDLTLVRGDLLVAVDAIRLSRKTLSTIKSNLFWAFIYNVGALPLAAAGLLNPMIAGAAMAFSSVFVVANSLRLRRFNVSN